MDDKKETQEPIGKDLKQTVESITDKVKNYLDDAGYPFIKILEINQPTNGEWIIKVDVGLSQEKVKTIKINDERGTITSIS